MNRGQIGGSGGGDVVEATHRNVGWRVDSAVRQHLQCAERQYVASLEGDAFKHRRRLLTPMFGRSNLVAIGDVVAAEFATRVDRWEKHVETGAVIDLQHEIWAGDRKVADAKSVLVGYDYAVGASAPLTDDQRRRLKSE